MPELFYRKASVHFIINQLDEARVALDTALTLHPDFAPGLCLLSEIQQAFGKLEDSIATIRRATAINPDLPYLYTTLGKAKTFTKGDPELEKLLELQQSTDRFGRTEKIALNYALFKAYEDIGEDEKAFDALKTGSDLKRATIPYHEDANRLSLDEMRRVFTKDYIDSFAGKGYESDLPVFIVGMPRSGTTLTEQIISSHPDIYGAGELMDLTAAEMAVDGELNHDTARILGETYVSRIRKLDKSGTALHISDKMPGNFMRLGLIAAALPNAKIIHCRRDPIDTCLSCYKQLFARGQYWSYDLEELGHFYQYYLAVMDHWRAVLPGRFYEISYEETVMDFENQARKLVDYVGVKWNDACLEPHKQKRAVLTASKTQVIKPVYQSSVASWRRYEKQLQPLIRIVAPELAQS